MERAEWCRQLVPSGNSELQVIMDICLLNESASQQHPDEQ